MELKRYVLLNNKMIYDLVVERDVERFNMVKNGKPIAYGVKKSSNNILDLVEVGDLVEHKTFGKMFVVVKYLGNYDEIYINDYNFHYDTVAIWKLQPNGDYKKYEVEKWLS